jgi:hypothetical protein
LSSPPTRPQWLRAGGLSGKPEATPPRRHGQSPPQLHPRRPRAVCQYVWRRHSCCFGGAEAPSPQDRSTSFSPSPPRPGGRLGRRCAQGCRQAEGPECLRCQPRHAEAAQSAHRPRQCHQKTKGDQAEQTDSRFTKGACRHYAQVRYWQEQDEQAGAKEAPGRTDQAERSHGLACV